LYAALDVASCIVITDIRTSRTSSDFVTFPNKVNANVPKGLDDHVMFDEVVTALTSLRFG
jgi:hypothetical protein